MASRILIVDDDALARQLYSDCLGEAGHEVVSVCDAPEASAALDKSPFDVVVTDLVLPGTDGLGVLADAKRRDPGIEVILITAVDRVDPAVRAMKSGAADYLVKPVLPESLQLSVSRCIATRQLLKENALLSHHLSLFETGQRLATTLDRERLFPMALNALVEALGARSALLLARGPDGRLGLVAQEGLADPEAQDFARDALPLLGPCDGKASDIEVGGRSFRALYAEDAGEVQGICLLQDPTSLAMAWASAQFLARHLALALQNLRRLSEVEDLVYLDDLTRLHNLRYLHLVLDREITNSKQTGAPFSVLFLDLDHFKRVNDTHGHLAGSKLLVEIAGLLKASVRDFDTAVRYGGDEYVVVLRHTDTGGALKVAERIRHSIEMHRFLGGEGLAVSLTVCIGVASYPEHAQDKASILNYSDRAMYRGKQSTRNVVYVASLPAHSAPASGQ
ncbi:MAG: diguanylate cyclase [Deltaproteobacteria bacterium]|nr:diguanylate cyclase [Deltaproteobacteria bacterium]